MKKNFLFLLVLLWCGLLQAAPVTPFQGGTGVANNNAATYTRSGNHALTVTTTGTTGVTFPMSGTLYAQDTALSALNAVHTSPAIGTKGIVNKNFAAQTANNFEAQSSGGTAYVTIGPDALAGDSATKNWINLTGTFPATTTAIVKGLNVLITGAGSSSFAQRAAEVQLSAGYTGSSPTFAGFFTNISAGTGASGLGGTSGNFGIQPRAIGTPTVGVNTGSAGSASGSSVLNSGAYGSATSATNSPALNAGVAGFALNGTVNVGGFFGLIASNPTLASSAALIADNGAVAADIFVARDNGTAVFTIADGGAVTSTASIGVSSAGSFNLASKAAINTAPTIASGLCTSPSVSASNGTAAFALTVGTSCTAVITGTLTMPAATTGWVCHFVNVTNPATNTPSQTGGSTTTVTFTNYARTTGIASDFTASDSIRVKCSGY